MSIKENYDRIKSQIDAACLRAGRSKDTVKLMLVTKTVPLDKLKQTIDFGHFLFGENKVQELYEKKSQLLNVNAQIHFIGHLQKNKIKKCVEYADVIQSVDHLSLAKELNDYLLKINKTKDILVQVNTSNEQSKFGVEPDQAIELIKKISQLSQLKIKGLMTLAKFSSDEDQVRPCFKTLKQIFDTVASMSIPGVSMEELSMGMSSDFEIAIEEGATLIRVGTAVFGKRDTSDSQYWPESKK